MRLLPAPLGSALSKITKPMGRAVRGVFMFGANIAEKRISNDEATGMPDAGDAKKLGFAGAAICVVGQLLFKEIPFYATPAVLITLAPSAAVTTAILSGVAALYIAGTAMAAVGFGMCFVSAKKYLMTTDMDERLDRKLTEKFGGAWEFARDFVNRKLPQYPLQPAIEAQAPAAAANDIFVKPPAAARRFNDASPRRETFMQDNICYPCPATMEFYARP